MRAVQFGIVDMAGFYVGTSNHGVVEIDVDGAGYGWFVDTTPGEDSEFNGSGTKLTADAGGAAEGKLDLLTVLMHELGHQIGLDDVYVTSEGDDVMFGYMHISERRLPAHGEADGAVPGSVGSTAFALTPVSIGTLPSNKTVDIFFKATIDLQFDKFISPLMNTATISGSNFANVLAVENNALDSLTLGSTVYVDANLNGVFDAGEGRTGVALELYADTNDSGGWDAGDVLLGSTTTGALGAYSFTGLAPGDYIVVVTAANFANGAALDDLLIVQGVAADPDNNVDNDNNGVAATGGAVASQTITLAYNTEPTAGTGNDTNNTLDFGFVANQPPVANDDSVSVAEDSGANDLTSQLLGNDTDPENDTKTITSATQGAHGTTSVVAGVLTYTPNGNYNGTDTFDYTISDGNGHTDTATVTVTVTAVNDPVTGSAPGTATLNEDATNVAIAGLSISDVDATLAPAGVYDVTLSATHGTLTLTTTTGLTFGTGDGAGDTTMTFHGTLADINTALATAKYTPDSNYNGSAQIDLQVTDTFGGIVATGTGSATNDTDSVAVTVNSVNDAPSGANQDSGALEGVEYVFTATDFSENFTDPIDGNGFAGIRITSVPATGTLKLNGVAISVPQDVTLLQLTNGNLTYLPAAGSANTSPIFQFRVRDDGGVLNGGQDLSIGEYTYTINIGAANAAPAVDLDGNDSNTVGTGFSSAYTEGGAAAAISDTDVLITDADTGDDIVSATITITDPETGDKLNVGALPGTVTVDPSSTAIMVKLVAAPGTSAADFEAAIEAITYSSTSDDPTDHGTNTARTITVTVNDGVSESAAATATVTITDDNADAPSGTSSTITALEDGFRLLEAVDLGFSDVDGSFASVTITGVTGGGLYYDADGTAGGGAPVLVAVFPATYTAQDLIDGKVSFKAGQDVNGSGIGTITFTVTDDDGNTDASPNTLTVDVTPVNDSPVLTATSPASATEQVATYILTGASVADVDLDARNGGLGDYAGAVFSVNRNPAANPTDDFELIAGPNFTIDGINLKSGGQIFGHISTDSNGTIAITFTSLETAATSALVDEVIQQIRYYYTGDNPPASVVLAVGFTDGSPGGGQGAGATGLDVELVTVNITAVDDPPVVTVADATVNGTEDVNLVFNAANGNAITVADIDSASLTVTLTVLHGKLTLSQTTGLSVTGDGTATVELTGSTADINAALEGLVYRGNLNYEGSDTLAVDVDDGTSTDSENIAITLADDGIIHGDSGDNTLFGTPQVDLFYVQQGGNDTVYGLASDDIFYFGSAFTGADTVDGDGGGKDVIVLQGNYNLTLSTTNITDVESLSLKSGAVTSFGDTANNFYDYDITTVDENVVAGGQLIVNGSSLRVGEDFTFDGSAEQDGKFLVLGGHGVDTLTGGAGNDIFIFDGTRWGSGDSVDGGSGRDSVVITAGNGTTHIEFGATSLIGVESLTVSNIYSSTPSATPDYEFVLDDGNVAAGQTLIVNGFTLTDPDQTISIDGSDESDGKLILFGGAGNDVLIGGDLGDTLYGAGRGDTLTGGLGNDIFRYDNVTDSNSTERDGIQDFTLGDVIDLSRIDADSVTSGDQAFTFIGNAAFSNVAGQLRFENISLGGPIWLVQGDTDGNGVSDFEVVLVVTDANPITAGDFIL
jgi:Ca2+-binding RTX toxin-like protein